MQNVKFFSTNLIMDNKEFRQRLLRRSFDFAVRSMELVDQLPSKSISLQTIGKQFIRSATSVGANIMEAQASPTKKDFANFINHALKSANESAFWLLLFKENKSISTNTLLVSLLKEVRELAKILGAILSTIRKTKKTTVA